jgi:hypothetical protein
MLLGVTRRLMKQIWHFAVVLQWRVRCRLRALIVNVVALAGVLLGILWALIFLVPLLRLYRRCRLHYMARQTARSRLARIDPTRCGTTAIVQRARNSCLAGRPREQDQQKRRQT